jgi:NTE family protein
MERNMPAKDTSPVRIGLALGGGFARGIAHAGVLQVLEQHRIPIHCIAGISAGAIVAAACASGTTPAEIAAVGCSMRFGDVGALRPGRLGLVRSACMGRFLSRLLHVNRFEEMRIPLGVLATELATGGPVAFRGSGSVVEPLRASCAFPGLFEPVRHEGRLLVDGAMSAGVPAALARQLGATHVISVTVPSAAFADEPGNLVQVVGRCFQILQQRLDDEWRREADLVIAPDVGSVGWREFDRGSELIQAGAAAAIAAVPAIERWLARASNEGAGVRIAA